MNTTAFITGASKGIGRAIAMKLAGQGCDIILAHLNEEELAQQTAHTIQTKLHRRCIILQGDLAKEGMAENLWQQAESACGEIGILINNAAVFHFASILHMKHEHLQRTMMVNYAAPIRLTQLAVRHMINHSLSGSVVTITSTRAERAYPGDALYGGMKAALKRSMESIALDAAPYRIRVNCIAPGAINTGAFPSADYPSKLGEKIPLGRMGDANDVANAAAWLVSEEAAYVTGATIRVDGGLILPGMPEDIRPEAGYGWGKARQREDKG